MQISLEYYNYHKFIFIKIIMRRDYPSYFYSIWCIKHHDVDLNQFLKERIWKTEQFIVEKINENQYFVWALKEKDIEVLPKIWDKNLSDIKALKTLELDENQVLYNDVFMIIDLWNKYIMNHSLWIIEVLNIWGKENISIVKKLLDDITWYNIEVLPICYNNKEKYLSDNRRKITRFSFKIASRNWEIPIIWLDDADWLGKLFKLKDEFNWESLEVIYSNKKWLNSNKVSKLIWKNPCIEFKEISVEELWKEIDQKINEIRFKDTIQLNVEDKQVISDVKLILIESYNKIINEIKEEYKTK